MKKRFSEEQIIRILKEHEAGKRAADILPLEKQIQQDGCQRGETTETVGRRKPTAKRTGGEPHTG